MSETPLKSGSAARARPPANTPTNAMMTMPATATRGIGPRPPRRRGESDPLLIWAPPLGPTRRGSPPSRCPGSIARPLGGFTGRPPDRGDQTNTQVARELRVTKQTVGKWRSRFLDQRVESLLDEPRPGHREPSPVRGGGSRAADLGE